MFIVTEYAAVDLNNVDLKTNPKQGISEPVFYDDLVNEFIGIDGKLSFLDQFERIIKRCNKYI